MSRADAFHRVMPPQVVAVYERLNYYIERESQLAPILQLLPGLVWVIGLLGVSLLMVVIYSFLTEAPPTEGTTVTLANYKELFATDLYRIVFLDSLIISIKVTVLGLLIGYPVAYFLTFVETKRKNIYLVLIILPFWMNLVIRTYAWRLILSSRGLVNFVLYNVLGVWARPHNLLFTQDAITIGLIHVLLPYFILPIYSSLDRIDRSYIEAAKNLGANKLETFYEVTLPLSLPGIAAGVVLVFVLSFGSFFIPLLLGGNRHIMIANIISGMFTQIQNWALGSAMSVVFVSLILTTVYVFNKGLGLEQLYSGGDTE